MTKVDYYYSVANYGIYLMLHFHDPVNFASRFLGNILDYWGELSYPNICYMFTYSLSPSSSVVDNFSPIQLIRLKTGFKNFYSATRSPVCKTGLERVAIL